MYTYSGKQSCLVPGLQGHGKLLQKLHDTAACKESSHSAGCVLLEQMLLHTAVLNSIRNKYNQFYAYKH
jgi:hypothetical protein